MKAFRGQPSIFAERGENSQADLTVKDLTLRFGGVVALRNVSIEVRTGELLALIGPNGAGKTSLLNCLTGYYQPQEGAIFFNGEDITTLPTHELVGRGIGRTFQNIELFPGMSVLSNMLMARHVHSNYGLPAALFFSGAVRREEVRHRRIVEEIMDFLEMQGIRKKAVGSLPYGLRKRVELGRALALEPKLLVLDEPFAGMNLEEKEDMVRFLMELHAAWGQTMILVEHDMSIVMSLSTQVVVLNFGEKLAEGTPEEVQNNHAVVTAYLGTDMII
ncbi:MAG: ABC transporter ATP-binding protein [Deltaproteobacteria bacterium]|nr:ABC transporter ATP-binding protein [Deltaproteobacteria bacterium]